MTSDVALSSSLFARAAALVCGVSADDFDGSLDSLQWLEVLLARLRVAHADDLPATKSALITGSVTYLGAVACTAFDGRQERTIVMGNGWRFDCQRAIDTFDGTPGGLRATLEQSCRHPPSATEERAAVCRFLLRLAEHEFIELAAEEPGEALLAKAHVILHTRIYSREDEARHLHLLLMSAPGVEEVFVDEAGLERAIRQWWQVD
jgi:hypothetical protein